VLEGGSSGNILQAPYVTADQYYTNPATHNPDNSMGVLLYLPGPTGSGYPVGCLTQTTPQSITMTGSSTMIIAPLNPDQSAYWFSRNTGASGVAIWEDATNTQSLTMKGSDTILTGAITGNPISNISSAAGLVYLPSATLITSNGSPNIKTGRMIVGGLSLSGTPNISLSGN
jgi:hypothetical protein